MPVGGCLDTAAPLSLLAIIARKAVFVGVICSNFPEDVRVLLDWMEPRERGALVDNIRRVTAANGCHAATSAVGGIVAAGGRPDRAAIDQTVRRLTQGDDPESSARLDTYNRFMKECDDE